MHEMLHWATGARTAIVMGEVNRLQGTIRGGQFHVGAHRWPLGYTPAYQGPVSDLMCPGLPCRSISLASTVCTPQLVSFWPTRICSLMGDRKLEEENL